MLVHRISNLVRIGTPEPSAKNPQKSDEAGSPRLGVALLLALQLSSFVLEFRRESSWWYGGYGPFWFGTDILNSSHLSVQRDGDIQRNYMEYVTI